MKEIDTISPSDLFATLGVEDNESSRKIFQAAFSFLLYINVGDELNLPNAQITKIAPDMLVIDQKLDNKATMDQIFRNKILKVDL